MHSREFQLFPKYKNTFLITGLQREGGRKNTSSNWKGERGRRGQRNVVFGDKDAKER